MSRLSGPNFKPVSRESLADQVYRQLREALMSGRFEPGHKFTIRGLAETLGASSMPIRDALNRLVAEGAFTVTESSRLRVPLITSERLREIRDARVALEGLLVERCIAKITSRDLAQISKLYEQMSAAVAEANASRYLWTNFAFHRRIYAVAQSDLIMAAVENFWLHVGPCFALVAPQNTHLHRSMEAHARILDALHSRDAAAARAAVADDIMQAADSLLKLLSAQASSTRTGDSAR
ncbi:GntR family transcriptional regulator [Solimonas marina]|uniref:GntR family transcriptional regulator n=1 Tax=Solimonas marina TaxID=2714601 RepID=A0A969WD62_9GAMM|nr:GntR family transcriptional regulator [Solimonas marina]NKF23221.1 GntR family transcriptional regulator [Solimonas marina]